MTRARSTGLVLGLVGLIAMALGACGGSEVEGPAGAGEPIQVVATTTQLTDLATEIGGPRVAVTGILKPDTDPHVFEPRPDDVIATAEADLVLVSGLGLDPWAEKLIAESASQAEVIDLGASLSPPHPGEGADLDHPHDHGHEHDPHWWHGPDQARAAVGLISAALASIDPAGRDEFRHHAVRFSRRLAEVDRDIRRCFEQLPARDRRLVTDHESLGYFADHYGLELVGAVIPSLTSGAQPSARDLKQLAEKITDLDVKAVFAEKGLNPGLAETLAGQTGASLGGELYADALGPPGSAGDTYLKMLAANADTIMRGLTGGRQGCRIGSPTMGSATDG